MDCCDALGLSDDGTLRLSRSADCETTLIFPDDVVLDDWTGQLQVRKTPGSTPAYLTITFGFTVNGSRITAEGNALTLTIKKADVPSLPTDYFEAAYEWVMTDPSGLTTRMIDGVCIIEYGVVA